MVFCAEGGDFVILKPGRYQLKIEDAAEGTSANGNAIFKIHFRVVSVGEFEGSDFDARFPLWKVSILGKAIGCKRVTDPLTKKAGYDVQPMDLIGKALSVTVENRSVQGQKGMVTFNDVQDDWELLKINATSKKSPAPAEVSASDEMETPF